MKQLIYLSFIFLLGCNSTKIKKDKRIDGFYFPYDSLMAPKVFISFRVDSPNIKTYDYQQIFIKDKDTFLINTSLDQTNIRDSSKYMVSNGEPKLIESFLIQKDMTGPETKISKGKIIKNISELDFSESKIKFFDPFKKILVVIVESTSKLDTISTIKFKDTVIPCLLYNGKIKMSIKIKYIPFTIKSLEKTTQLIYAKNLGLIESTGTDIKSGEKITWKLDTIIKYTDYNKQTVANTAYKP